jgi:cellobiose phosphorylase
MKYGYFDDDAKEYVITRPDTPQSWSNYLGSTEYGAIITNNAGGYGFYQSGARGRFMRLLFNRVPIDQPGRYFYLRDGQSGDYWSTSWQPVGKPLDQYQSICRHGTAYTTILSRYAGIASETTYFVPLGQKFEYWRMKITNESDQPRQLSAFTFCEFTNQWVTTQDQVNLQYSLFIVRGEMTEGLQSMTTCHPKMTQPILMTFHSNAGWLYPAPPFQGMTRAGKLSLVPTAPIIILWLWKKGNAPIVTPTVTMPAEVFRPT